MHKAQRYAVLVHITVIVIKQYFVELKRTLITRVRYHIRIVTAILHRTVTLIEFIHSFVAFVLIHKQRQTCRPIFVAQRVQERRYFVFYVFAKLQQFIRRSREVLTIRNVIPNVEINNETERTRNVREEIILIVVIFSIFVHFEIFFKVIEHFIFYGNIFAGDFTFIEIGKVRKPRIVNFSVRNCFTSINVRKRRTGREEEVRFRRTRTKGRGHCIQTSLTRKKNNFLTGTFFVFRSQVGNPIATVTSFVIFNYKSRRILFGCSTTVTSSGSKARYHAKHTK